MLVQGPAGVTNANAFEWTDPPRQAPAYDWRAPDIRGPLAIGKAGGLIISPPGVNQESFLAYHRALDQRLADGETDHPLPWYDVIKPPAVLVDWTNDGLAFSLPGECGGGLMFFDNTTIGWERSARHALQTPMLRMERLMCGLLGQTAESTWQFSSGLIPWPEVEIWRCTRSNHSFGAAVMHLLRCRLHKSRFEMIVEAQPALQHYRPRVCLRLPGSRFDERKTDAGAWFLLFAFLPALGLRFECLREGLIARTHQDNGQCRGRDWGDLMLLCSWALLTVAAFGYDQFGARKGPVW